MNEYFAAKPTPELLQELVGKIQTWNRYIERRGLRKKWQKLYETYYGKQMGEGGGGATSEISRVGDEGEFTAFATNHFRNLIKHQLSLSCSQKPSFDPRAKNTDLKSLQQAKLAGNVIDSYVVEKRIGRYFKSAAERSLVFNKGFVLFEWDPSLGRPFGVKPQHEDDGTPIVDHDGEQVHKVQYEGDVRVQSFSPWDIMYDIHLSDWNDRDWDLIRCRGNKYTLAARYPHMRDDILSMSSADDLNEFGTWRSLEEVNDGTDMITFYKLYHRRTEALPNGRYTVFFNDSQDAAYDGPIPYKRLPVFRITPGEVFDTAEGYSESNDTVVLQDAYNLLNSTAFTNEMANGINVIWLPDGCDASASQIGKGLAVLKGGAPGTEPKVLSLTNTAPEIFKNMDRIQNSMQLIMGINDTIRGDPEKSLKSGAALGRMQAMAIQFASNFQESWAELLEDGATFLLGLLQDFASTERMVALAGKHNKGAMASFTGDDIKGIDRVVVDLGNPMSRTVAGRMDQADMLMSKGLVKTPQEYFTLISTGQLDPMTEGPEAQLALIRKENEDLMDGVLATAVVGDPHLLHMQEHGSVIADSTLRSMANQGDPQAIAVIQATTQHIQWHQYLYKTQDSIWSAVSGEPPAPPPPPMVPPPMPPPFPNGTGQIQPPEQAPPPPPPPMMGAPPMMGHPGMMPPPGPMGPHAPPQGPHGMHPPGNGPAHGGPSQGLPPNLIPPVGPPTGPLPMPPIPKPFTMN